MKRPPKDVYEAEIEVVRCDVCGKAACACIGNAEPLVVTVTGYSKWIRGCPPRWSEWDGGDPGEPDSFETELRECRAGGWTCEPEELTERERETARDLLEIEAERTAEADAYDRADYERDLALDRKLELG